MRCAFRNNSVRRPIIQCYVPNKNNKSIILFYQVFRIGTDRAYFFKYVAAITIAICKQICFTICVPNNLKNIPMSFNTILGIILSSTCATWLFQLIQKFPLNRGERCTIVLKNIKVYHKICKGYREKPGKSYFFENVFRGSIRFRMNRSYFITYKVVKKPVN